MLSSDYFKIILLLLKIKNYKNLFHTSGKIVIEVGSVKWSPGCPIYLN